MLYYLWVDTYAPPLERWPLKELADANKKIVVSLRNSAALKAVSQN